MTDATKLGPWVRRFLLEYLVGERNLARNTQTQLPRRSVPNAYLHRRESPQTD
jgi:hypothetical protein